MSKGFWAVIIAVVLIFLGIATLGGNNKESGSKTSTKQLSQHYTGNLKSSVLLTEYGDYQCPYCQDYAPTVKAIIDQYSDRVKFQFRHFPITERHPNAFAAARAAEAASLQGKFWQMHDTLYDASNNAVWTAASDPTSNFETYASQIGLNVAQFQTDFKSSRVNDIINADMSEGNRIGVSGTPTFFINGKKVEIANDLKTFQKIIDNALAQANSKS